MTRRSVQQRRAELLDRLRDLFLAEGFSHFTLDELARRLSPAIGHDVEVAAGRLGDRAEAFGAIVLATHQTSAHLLKP